MGNKGFTLVELAIVMIIIGLLIGGILKGQEMIQSSRITRAASDLKSFESAMQTFRDMYKAWPGDINNASSVLNPGAGNGNGNGKIDVATETGLAFQHLSMANLIPGSYDNTYGLGGVIILGRTVPTGPVSGSGYLIAWVGNHHGYTGNIIGYAIMESASSSLSGSVFTPRDAQRLDLKIDDGNPTTGRVLAFSGLEIFYGGLANRCTTSASPADSADPYGSADYNLAEIKPSCRIMFQVK